MDEGYFFQANMEEIKSMVEEISIFQENWLWDLTRFPKMPYHDKECYIQACDRCVERGKEF